MTRSNDEAHVHALVHLVIIANTVRNTDRKLERRARDVHVLEPNRHGMHASLFRYELHAIQAIAHVDDAGVGLDARRRSHLCDHAVHVGAYRWELDIEE